MMNEETPGRNGRAPRRPRIDASKLFENRLPPHSPEAEMSLLGSLILDPQVMGDVLAQVSSADDFYVEAHGAIFSALVSVYEKHQRGDLVELVDSIRDQGLLDQVGGAEYLVRLAEQVPSAVNAPHYARLVAEKARLRRLIDAASEILYEAYHSGELGPEGAKEVVDRAETAVFQIAQQAERSQTQKLSELLMAEMERLDKADGRSVTGLPTGFGDLDQILSGLQAGEMIIVAGRPSMGKTALALNLAEQIALGGKTPWDASARREPAPVGIFSLEMSRQAVVQRLLSAYSGVDSKRIRTGNVRSEFQDLMRAAGELALAPIYIDDTPGLSITALRARARRMAHQHKIKALMIDYLQLLTAPAQSRESRQVEVSAISRGIKALARELEVPVICLSQLNRGSEQREGHRPRMSDLRESGSIEQDADVIVLIHREDYYHQGDPHWLNDPDNRDKVGVTELIIAKQRNGPTGLVRLTWDPQTTRFKAWAGRSDAGWGDDDPWAEFEPKPPAEKPRENPPRSAIVPNPDAPRYSSSGPGFERPEDDVDEPPF